MKSQNSIPARWRFRRSTTASGGGFPRTSLMILLLISVPGILILAGAIDENQERVVYATQTGIATFQSSVPLHEFTGKSDHLAGMIDFDRNLVDFYLDLRSLETGNNRRDRDIYSTLNTEEFPYVEFTGELVTPFNPADSSRQQVTVSGTFTINGITREKRVEGWLRPTADGIQLQTGWTQSLDDHEIEPPGILFYRVRDHVEVQIEATLRPNPPEINVQS
ncbi:MAG: YceI family protein [Balneolaceae bacterium]